MKIILAIFVFAISLSCNGNTKENSNKKNTVTIIKPIIVNNTKSSIATNNPIVTSVTFVSEEIIGDNHYGFKYDFTINIDNSNNFDILNFCKLNLASILNNRVTDIKVIENIISQLNRDKADVDENPKSLRLVTSTENFDTVEVEIYLKENNLLKMDLKYYSPL